MDGNNNSSKQILLSVLGVAILVVAVVGVSFAAFTFSQAGKKENKITTGTITLTYTEDNNGITIDNALPTNDETGKALSAENQYFDFTIDANINGDTTIDYVISAKKVEAVDGNGLDNNDVKLYLENITSKSASASQPGTAAGKTSGGPLPFTPSGEADDETGLPVGEMILEKGTINQTQTKYYRLRMWLSEDYGSDDPTGSKFKEAKTFTVKVNVYAKAAAE